MHPTRCQDDPIPDPIRLRLMVHLTDANATVKMLLPLLSGFFNSSKLPSSGLELLDFDDLGIMREVKSRLCEQHAESPVFPPLLPLLPMPLMPATALANCRTTTIDILDIMLDDFPVASKAQPDKDDVAAAATAAMGPAGHDSSQQQSGAADPREAKQWHLEAIGAASAWAITRGLPDVIVAVVDNGVDLDHPDIRPNLWINQHEMDGKAGIDDDGNGYVDDVYGYDAAGPCSFDWRSSASTRLSSFKYVEEDVMVAVCGHLKLPEAGQYGVRLATASPLARLAVTVGQRQLVWQAGPGGGREVVLQVPQPGWYELELLYANSSQSLELSWALPSSPRTFGALPDSYLGTGSMTRSTAPAHAPASLPVPGAVPSGFQVLWQPVVPGSTNGSWDGGFLATLDAKRFYPYSSIVEDVSYTSSGALAGALAGGGGSTSMTAAGGALYGLDPSRRVAGWLVTCSFCSLYVGDMLVLEVLDPASPATGPLTTRLSSCLMLGPTASTPGPAPPSAPAAGARLTTATYPLQLRFATPNASVSALVLQWAPCNSSPATFAPLAPLLAGGLWYREPAPQPAAAVGRGNGTMVPAAAASPLPPPSMQCDAWNSSALASPLPGKVAVLPRPEEVAPAYSFHLPSPNASFVPCPGPIGTPCPSGRSLTFRIADLYPALLRSSEPLYVRCWAWWSSSFRGGLLTVSSSRSLNTAVYVAGQRVFYSVEAIFGGPTNRQPSAPNTTSLAGGYRQLLALEWHGVKPAARLSVMDGSMDGMLMNATLLIANMFAPAA
ncbi:hypothetical protein TSOC_003805 [Tetrabaena socialis]|uniref:Subtilisin n=1 Tax=Tetrabaena socialis TaxID=47790 RepID=A0A2J8AAJ4_9CHLO|nr:hypothetical protein TSOC_003805 [Tetrabaena socialis]|eukprot:PNH09549.1 hypothetical protein TSOC_003805 [Tetrabaena socialis]